MKTPNTRRKESDMSMSNNHEHIHISIPEIIKGKVENNIAQVPGSNRCIVCGEKILDTVEVLKMHDIFLEKERCYAQSQDV